MVRAVVPPTPNAWNVIIRKDIEKESEFLQRYVQHKLQQYQLGNAHAPPSTGLRPTTSGTSLTASASYHSLTSASIYGLRGGNSRSRLSNLQITSPALTSSASFGDLSLGKQSWQPNAKGALQGLPTNERVEARWPSILASAIDSRPVRPELRNLALAQQDDNMRWMAGAWRVRDRTSPRPSPL